MVQICTVKYGTFLCLVFYSITMSQMLQIPVLEAPFDTSIAKTVKCTQCGKCPKNGIVLIAAKIGNKIEFYCTEHL